MSKKLLLLYLFSLGLFCASGIQAQEGAISTPKNQLEFRHDNDFILLTDRYYSSGLFLTYRRGLSKGIFNAGAEQLGFQLVQQAYTPENIDSRNLNAIDRPYAGFTGLESSWSLAKGTYKIETKFLLGFTGQKSGAGEFQQWHHKNIVLASVPTWFTEIEDSFHANLEIDFVKEWQWAPNPFSMHVAIQPAVAFGTKDIYVQPEIVAYFGRRNPLETSIAYNQIGSTDREIFFSFRYAYRFVWHNALLEGNILGDNSVYTIPSEKRVTIFGFDVHHRSSKNEYTFGYRLNSKEAAVVGNHKYVILAYGRSF